LLVTSNQFLVGLVDVAENIFAVLTLNLPVCVKKNARWQIIFLPRAKFIGG
jgi:hypothetical protein